MNLLPTDIIHLVFDLLPLKDKRSLLMTCSKYYKLRNIIMKNVIYHVFLIYYKQGPAFCSLGIFNNLNDCRNYIITFQGKKEFNPISNLLTEHNYYTIISTRAFMSNKYNHYYGSYGFLIEEQYIGTPFYTNMKEYKRYVMYN